MDSGFKQERGRFIPTDDKTWSPTTSRFIRREIAKTAARGPTPEEANAFPRLFSPSAKTARDLPDVHGEPLQ